MPSTPSQTLAPPPSNERHQSLSTINSDTATYHSLPGESTDKMIATSLESSPIIQPVKMARTDSGYEEDIQITQHRRSTSTTSSRHRKQPSSKTRSASISTSRAASRRTSRSIPSTNFTHTRTAVQARTTTLPSSQQPHQYHEFFQFPSMLDPSEEMSPSPAPPLPPPATVHYWTSEESRRLEYAAIDAASRGVRGFVTKILPDCVLPCEYRRTRFHSRDEDADSDAGSVRRYRLSLPEEKTQRCTFQLDLNAEDKPRRSRFMSKLSGFRRAITS